MTGTVGTARVARATVPGTVRIGLAVLAPMLAQGVIVRRPWMLGLAERLDLDRRAGRILQAARDRYGAGLLRLRVPGRSDALATARPSCAGTASPYRPAPRSSS